MEQQIKPDVPNTLNDFSNYEEKLTETFPSQGTKNSGNVYNKENAEKDSDIDKISAELVVSVVADVEKIETREIYDVYAKAENNSKPTEKIVPNESLDFDDIIHEKRELPENAFEDFIGASFSTPATVGKSSVVNAGQLDDCKDFSSDSNINFEEFSIPEIDIKSGHDLPSSPHQKFEEPVYNKVQPVDFFNAPFDPPPSSNFIEEFSEPATQEEFLDLPPSTDFIKDHDNLISVDKFEPASSKPTHNPPSPLSPIESSPNTLTKSYVIPSSEQQKIKNNQPIFSQFSDAITSIPEPVSSTPPIHKQLSERSSDLGDIIGPRDIIPKYALGIWRSVISNPTVEAFIYWRDPKSSAVVFVAGLILLLSMAYYSVISVVANSGLLVLLCAMGFRVYKHILQAVQKTQQSHPYSVFLEFDIALPKEKVHEIVDVALIHINVYLSVLRRRFLIENWIESIKFGVGLWVFTYVGSWFNGLTLVIIVFVSLFTLPKVYENNKVQIDQNLALVHAKLEELTNKVKDLLPGLLRKKVPVAEKKE